MNPCPIRDLAVGQRYAPHDPAEPWRRMPMLFDLCRSLLGRGMYAPGSRTRKAVDGALVRHCALTRARFGEGTCTRQRSGICQAHLLEGLSRGGRTAVQAQTLYQIGRVRSDDRFLAEFKAAAPVRRAAERPLHFQRV